jgi:hypothetical protein
MMTTIQSFELEFNQFDTKKMQGLNNLKRPVFAKTVTIKMPSAHGILSVRVGTHQPVLYVRVDKKAEIIKRTFRFVLEGEDIELDERNYVFVGAFTYQTSIVHIFEVK